MVENINSIHNGQCDLSMKSFNIDMNIVKTNGEPITIEYNGQCYVSINDTLSKLFNVNIKMNKAVEQESVVQQGPVVETVVEPVVETVIPTNVVELANPILINTDIKNVIAYLRDNSHEVRKLLLSIKTEEQNDTIKYFINDIENIIIKSEKYLIFGKDKF